MQSMLTRTFRIASVALCVLLTSAPSVRAQSIEPRSYSNAPVGVNFLIGGYAYTRGGISFDPSLPIIDPKLKTSSAVAAYARTLDLWGTSGKFDVIVPYTWLSGSATYQGAPVQREVNGFGDPLLRLSVNFYGAPALTLPEFRVRARPHRRRKPASVGARGPVRRHQDRQPRRTPLVLQA